MPNANNSIFFKRNKTFTSLRPSKIDYKTIKILANEVKNYFSFKPEKETNFDLKFNVKKFEDASHHMGGLRFDFDKNFSVVDKNLKILGLKKVYVCGSAIFPTSGSVNPTMTICALSTRLGEHLNKT